MLFVASISQAETPKEIFDRVCAKCHGKDGKGKTPEGIKRNITNITNAKFQESLKDSDAFKRIKEGIKKDNKVKMEPEPNLSDEQVKELIIYVRSLKEK